VQENTLAPFFVAEYLLG